MAFKKMDDSLGFADLALKSSRKNNRSIKNMKKLEKAIDWSRIESILQSAHQTTHRKSADKGYAGRPNRDFLAENKIADGIMRKDSTTAKLTAFEIERNKKISKVRYIVEQYFGISHLKDNAKRARFPEIAKNKFDCWYRQAAYNISKGVKILRVAAV